jgi:predicted AAA+ superfamily ATPase
MFKRDVTPILLKYASQYPVIAVLGPRQSGKTTLAQMTFPKHSYISFEDYDQREFALTDPRKFLAANKNEYGLILDEIQHVPQLLSYIQTYVDADDKSGYFILTGSQNFLVQQTISQTLAGRMAIVTLLPLSINELRENSLLSERPEEAMFAGGYPRIFSKKLEPTNWFSFYTKTYLEQDVRQITQVHDLNTFEKFLRMCAGRIGQTVNFSVLANDCGITHNTAKAWLSILEASYIIYFLTPHYKNFNKRLTKTPKLYFYDTGLACFLLSIKNAQQLYTHYLRGPLFESAMITEIIKTYHNKGQNPNAYFWQDSQGHEIDCLLDEGGKLIPIEIKSAETIVSTFFDSLNYWYELSETKHENGYVIYGGLENQERTKANIVSWQSVGQKIDID